ncbi:MAG: hypothetical protein ABI551_16655 [Polyangiaceae bacterium]
MANRFSEAAGRFTARLPRVEINFHERRNSSIAIIAAGVALFFAIPILVESILIARRAQITDLREAIESVQSSRASIRDRQARHDQVAMRYAKKVPLLAGFLQETARAQKLEVTDSTDRPDVPIGKKYIEKSTVVHLKKVGMYPLAKFMEAIEQSGSPVTISQLALRKRGGENDSYDVEISLSAFERIEAPAPASSATKDGNQ